MLTAYIIVPESLFSLDNQRMFSSTRGRALHWRLFVTEEKSKKFLPFLIQQHEPRVQEIRNGHKLSDLIFKMERNKGLTYNINKTTLNCMHHRLHSTKKYQKGDIYLILFCKLKKNQGMSKEFDTSIYSETHSGQCEGEH